MLALPTFLGWPSIVLAFNKMPVASCSKKEPRPLVVQLRDTQSRKKIGIVGMYLPAMQIFLCLLRLAA